MFNHVAAGLLVKISKYFPMMIIIIVVINSPGKIVFIPSRGGQSCGSIDPFREQNLSPKLHNKREAEITAILGAETIFTLAKYGNSIEGCKIT